MSAVDTDRWLCPVCHQSVVVYGQKHNVHAAIVGVQMFHADRHRKAGKHLEHVHITQEGK